MSGVGPLAGVRVLELSSYVATPLCGLVLSQLGADVVRLEPPGGAPDRTRLPLAPDGTSLYWSGLNKGKRAIEVDVRDPRGNALAADLAVETGLVVTNAAHRGALTPEALRDRRPDLIHVRLTGRADGGPSVDYTTQAKSGFQGVTGPRGHAGPVNHVMPAWDVAAGLYLATGLLAALHRREVTGEGATITLALEDVALSTAGHLGYLTEAQTVGISRTADDNYVYGTYGRDFALADGRRVMLVVLTDRHWRSLLAATGLTDAVAGLESALSIDLSGESSRYEHRGLVSSLLEPWFAARTLPGLAVDLAEVSALWTPYRSFDEVAATLADDPLFARIDQPGIGEHLAPGSPLVVDGERALPVPAPAVGQHTREVVAAALALPDHELDLLTDRQPAGSPTPTRSTT